MVISNKMYFENWLINIFYTTHNYMIEFVTPGKFALQIKEMNNVSFDHNFYGKLQCDIYYKHFLLGNDC